MALLSWSTIFHLPLDSILANEASSSFELVAQSCIQSTAELLTLQHLARPLERVFLKADPTKLEPWRDIMDRNSPGQAPAGAPVFLAQGTADVIVRPDITVRSAKRLCAAGTPVVMKLLKGVSHSFVVVWMTNRFNGRPAPSDCER